MDGRRSWFCILASGVFVVACAQSDAGITSKVKMRLAGDDLVEARHIDVDTRDRIVTLTGTVGTSAEETAALAIARRTEGVSEVVDQIAVVPAGEEGAVATSGRAGEGLPATLEIAVTDAGITGGVKTKLLLDPDVGGLKIDVETHDRVVTLTGTVKSSAEKTRALKLAGEVSSVAGVEDRLTVRAPSR